MKIFAIICCSCILSLQVVSQTNSKKRNFIAKRGDVDIEKSYKKTNTATAKSKKETVTNKALKTKKLNNATSEAKKSKRGRSTNASLEKVKLKKVSKKETTSKADLVRIKSNNKRNKRGKDANTSVNTKTKTSSASNKKIALLTKTRRVKQTTKEIAKIQYNANRRKAARMPELARNSRSSKIDRSRKRNSTNVADEPVAAANNRKENKIAEVGTADAPLSNTSVKEEKKVEVTRRRTTVQEKMNEALADQKLLFPIPNGTIRTGFGLQRIEQGVDINNPGLTIAATPSSNVLASFDGTISNIIEEDANYYTVYIVHNGFMTTYHGVTNVLFVKGNAVTRGTKIGEVGIDVESGEAEIEFLLTELISKKQQNLNPQKYLE